MTSRRRHGALLLAVASVALLAGCSAVQAAPTGAGGPSPAAVPAPPPVTVPLTSGDGGLRTYADITVGGALLRVLVDTGSVGLRVLADKVPAPATTPVGPAPPVSYGSGVALTGTVVRTTVGVGSVTSPGPVPVELVTATSCVPRKPTCEAANGHVTQEFGGQAVGILGIAPAATPAVPNPFWYLGPAGHAYAIHHDPAGGDTLVLGAPADGFSAEKLAAVRRPADPPDAPPAWQPRVPICFDAAPLPGGHLCSPSLLDTGTASLATINAPGAPPTPLPAGTPLRLGTASGSWSALYTVGRGDSAALAPPPSGNPGSVVGLPAFARADVRFDLDTGTIGLRPH
jgi:hypothetical protein